MKATDKNIQDAIIEKLLKRDPGKTICPSEIARDLFPDNWRDEMENVRKAAKVLVKEGKLSITQAGQEVDPDHFKGAIRLRLK